MNPPTGKTIFQCLEKKFPMPGTSGAGFFQTLEKLGLAERFDEAGDVGHGFFDVVERGGQPFTRHLPFSGRDGMIPAMKKNKAISSDPAILGGTPVFAGTRVPVKTLIDSLEAGDSIDLFLSDFPSVARSQIVTFLEMTKEMLLATA